MANTGQQGQGETATRLSFFGPRIKSENDELSTLGGMTRLVPRKSSSSPSYTGSSPASQPSSPPPPPPSVPTETHSFGEAANVWQNYNPMQQGYSDTAQPYPMQQTQSPIDVSLMYNAPPQNLPLEMMPEYYPYQSQGGGYGMQALNSPALEASASPPHHYQLPVDSWQNFFSQYKP